jgi:hypothetical protein
MENRKISAIAVVLLRELHLSIRFAVVADRYTTVVSSARGMTGKMDTRKNAKNCKLRQRPRLMERSEG